MYFFGIFETDVLINVLIPLRQTEAITWQNRILAVEKKDPAFLRSNFSHVIIRYNLWRIYNTARIPAKRNRISSKANGDNVIATSQFVCHHLSSPLQ